ncbi:MAG: Hsp20/alpha crystallin family protein [Cyclobacteriaceae bacterium]|nr:Hsp20/alpha crystallin family protein [Cyclobacteriaceae bacterium]
MTLIKYNPSSYRPATFSSVLDKFFNDAFQGERSLASFSPQVDIAETGKNFEIQFHLPGVKKEEINISVHDDRLTVSGERKMENEKKEKNFHTVESYYGTFNRSFYMPDNVNLEKIDASYKDGILTILIPKDEKKELKRTISIR